MDAVPLCLANQSSECPYTLVWHASKQPCRFSSHVPTADDQLDAVNTLATADGVFDGHLDDVKALEAPADIRVVVDAQHGLANQTTTEIYIKARWRETAEPNMVVMA